MTQASPESESMQQAVSNAIRECLRIMKERKPNDRSETDRHMQVLITDAEKLYAYAWIYLTD